jgi:hypothetical protein
MTDKELLWDPDEVIPRPKEPTAPEKEPLTDKERESRERFDRYWESLTPEQRHARAERFVWKPGDLRRVDKPSEDSEPKP